MRVYAAYEIPPSYSNIDNANAISTLDGNDTKNSYV